MSKTNSVIGMKRKNRHERDGVVKAEFRKTSLRLWLGHGTGKTTFLMEFLVEGIKRGRNVDFTLDWAESTDIIKDV